MPLFDAFERDPGPTKARLEKRMPPAELAAHLLGQSRRLRYNSLWFWWLVRTVDRALRAFARGFVVPDAVVVTQLFVQRLRLNPSRRQRLARLVFSIIRNAARGTLARDRDQGRVDDLDMALFLAHAFPDQPAFPWVDIVHLTAGAAGIRPFVSPGNRHDAGMLLARHSPRLAAALAAMPSHPTDLLPQTLACLLAMPATAPALLPVVHLLVVAQPALTREQLVAGHMPMLFWMAAHALLAVETVAACGARQVQLVFARLALALANRQIYMLRFCWHRLRQLLTERAWSGAAQTQLQHAVVLTLVHVPGSRAYFRNMAHDRVELHAWQRLFGGPGMLAHTMALCGVDCDDASPPPPPLPDCVLSCDVAYERAILSDVSDPPVIGMETFVRHLTVAGNTDPLTNLNLDEASITRLNPCLGEKISTEP